jgi:hypothetical protein
MVEICKGKKLAYAKNKRRTHGIKGASKQSDTAMQGINQARTQTNHVGSTMQLRQDEGSR